MHTKQCFLYISLRHKFEEILEIVFRKFVLPKNCAKISFCKITQNFWNLQKLLLLRYFIVNKMTFCLGELWSCILRITCMWSSFCPVLVYITLHFRPYCFLQHYIFMFLCVCVCFCIFHFLFFCSMLWIRCPLKKFKNICIIYHVFFYFVLTLYKRRAKI